jgi:3'(2'), 5'-bisphosphate nucleotidase
MRKPEIPEEYQIAIRAAVQAAKLVLGYFRTNQLETEWKADESPVTIADLESSLLLTNELQKTGIPVLSEEGGEIPYEERKKWNELWIVDPLDGTKEFIAGRKNFAINVALVRESRPIFGVIVIPVTGEVFFGGAEFGSYTTTTEDILLENSVKLPTENTPRKVLVVAGGKSTSKDFFEETELVEKNYDSIEFRKVASSVKFCLMAKGQVDIYPRDYPCMEWDTASGHAILQGIGKDIYRKETGKPLQYNKEDLYVPYFISC